MNRNLDGIYFRIERGGIWQSVCLSDMTAEEIRNLLSKERYSKEFCINTIILLTQALHKIGDDFDIERR